jgi:hypothetical protein
MMNRRKARQYDDGNYEERYARKAAKKQHGMKVINIFADEDLDGDDLYDAYVNNDDSVKQTKSKQRKH